MNPALTPQIRAMATTPRSIATAETTKPLGTLREELDLLFPNSAPNYSLPKPEGGYQFVSLTYPRPLLSWALQRLVQLAEVVQVTGITNLPAHTLIRGEVSTGLRVELTNTIA